MAPDGNKMHASRHSSFRSISVYLELARDARDCGCDVLFPVCESDCEGALVGARHANSLRWTRQLHGLAQHRSEVDVAARRAHYHKNTAKVLQFKIYSRAERLFYTVWFSTREFKRPFNLETLKTRVHPKAQLRLLICLLCRLVLPITGYYKFSTEIPENSAQFCFYAIMRKRYCLRLLFNILLKIMLWLRTTRAAMTVRYRWIPTTRTTTI